MYVDGFYSDAHPFKMICHLRELVYIITDASSIPVRDAAFSLTHACDMMNITLYYRVQNSSRLSAVAGTLTTLAGYFSPKKYKISCLDRSTEIKVAVS